MGVLTFMVVATDMNASGAISHLACSLIDGVNASTASGTKLKVYVLPKELLMKHISNGACITKNAIIMNGELVGKQGDFANYAKMQVMSNNNYSLVGSKPLVYVSSPSESSILALDPSSMVKIFTADSLNSLAPEARPKFANIDYTLAPGKITVTPKSGKYEQVKPVAIIPPRSSEVPDKPPIGKLASETGGITKVFDKAKVNSDEPYVAVKASEASASETARTVEEKRRSRLISGGSVFDSNSVDLLGKDARCNPYSMSFRYSYAPDADMSSVPDWGNYRNRGLDPNKPEDRERALKNCNCQMKWTAAMRTLTAWSTHLASYFSQMKLIATRSVETLGVNTKEFVVNPDYISTKTNAQLMFLLYHELFHVLLGHTVRCGDRDHTLWNIACDAIINASLCKEFGIDWKNPDKPVPVEGVNTIIKTIAGVSGGIFDDVDLDTETAESYYDKLLQRNGESIKEQLRQAIEQAKQDSSVGTPESQAQADKGMMERAKELQKQAEDLASALGDKSNSNSDTPDDRQKAATDKGIADKVAQAMSDLADILESDMKSCEMVSHGSQPGAQPMTKRSYSSIAGDTGRAANLCDQMTSDIDSMSNPNDAQGNNLGNKSDSLAEQIQKLAEDLRNMSNQGTGQPQQGQQSGSQSGQGQQSGQQGQQSGSQSGSQNGQGQQSGQGQQGGSQPGQGQQGDSQMGSQSGSSGTMSGQGGSQGGQSGSQGGQSGGSRGNRAGDLKIDPTGISARVKIKLNAGEFNVTVPVDIDPTNGDSPLDKNSSGPRLPGMKDSYGGLTDLDLQRIREQELKDLLGKAKSVAEIYKSRDGASREIGVGGGSLLGRMFQMMEVDPVNWKTLLKKFVNATEKKDYSLSTPYRPLVDQNLYIPGERRCDPDALYDLIIAIDTSGSITDTQLNEAMGQIYRMYAHFKIRGWILWWSDSVTSADAITKRADLNVTKPTSTGGTNIASLISWLDSHAGRGNHSRVRKGHVVCSNLNPCAVLVITDGYVGTIPKSKKLDGKKFIWLITEKSNYLNFDPPYGIKAMYDNNYSI